MMIAKIFVLLVLALVYSTGTPLEQHKNSKKSSVLTGMSRRTLELLTILREKVKNPEKDRTHIRKHRSIITETNRMLERRRKLEALIKRSPGLRALLKSVLEKRKAEELRSSQSDAQNCIPGLFYCRDESEIRSDASSRTREHLKNILNSKESDAKKYCPPGFFYCPKNDAETDSRRLDVLDKMFPERRHEQDNKEMRELDRIANLIKKRNDAEDHHAQVMRVPASETKETMSDEASKVNHAKGEKLVDDLMNSLQHKKASDQPVHDKATNFNVNQLMELLKE